MTMTAVTFMNSHLRVHSSKKKKKKKAADSRKHNGVSG